MAKVLRRDIIYRCDLFIFYENHTNRGVSNDRRLNTRSDKTRNKCWTSFQRETPFKVSQYNSERT